MPINRANIIEAEFLKHRRWRNHAFGMLFHALGNFLKRRRGRQNSLSGFFSSRIKLAGHQLREIVIHGTNGFGNRHIVVVQNHNHIFATHIVHRFKRHAASNSAVADDGD